MFPKKKVYIISAILVASVAITIIAIVKLGGNKEKASHFVSTTCRTLHAVPVDAVGLWIFKSPSVLGDNLISGKHPFSSLLDQQSGLYKIANRLSYLLKSDSKFSFLGKSELCTSLHYSGKNEVSVLISLNLEHLDTPEEIALLEKLTEGNKGTYREFNGATLYNSSGAIVTIHKDFLLASSSPLLVEASVRHLNSGVSILDNTDFDKIASETEVEDNLLFVNHIQIGKLFSGLSASKYLKHADFVSKFSSWSVMNASFDENQIEFDGTFYNIKGAGNFASSLEWKADGESEAKYIVPHNTFILLSLSPGDLNKDIDKIREYRELSKKLNQQNWDKAKEWLSSSEAEEISFAAIPYGGRLEWVTLIRHAKVNLFKKINRSLFSNGTSLKDTIIRNEYSGLTSELVGSLFLSNKEEFQLLSGEWTILGSEDILKEFSSGRSSKFSMANFIDQTPASASVSPGEAPFSFTVNYTGIQDTISALFKKGISESVRDNLSKRNLGIIQFEIKPFERRSDFKIVFYARNLEKLPIPPVDETETGPAGWQTDSIVKVPEGPFELRNFETGEKEYLVQLKNYRLQLADKDLKGIWAIPFQTPLRGYVEQVDFFNNGKLQMLFASGNMIYLLDRTGRYVNPYPKKVSKLVELGPKIYRSGDSFLIMLLHTDNTIGLYDRECRPVQPWTDIDVEETIKEFPELIEVSGNRYWVLRTRLKTRIYTINGMEVTSVLGNSSLLPTTPVKKSAGHEVEVRRADGVEIRLNLETGEIKKLKKRR